jgi:hypothetical protein
MLGIMPAGKHGGDVSLRIAGSCNAEITALTLENLDISAQQFQTTLSFT